MKVIVAGNQEVNSIATNLALKSTLCTLIENKTRETQELLSVIKEDLIISQLDTVKSGRENRRERRKRERKNK